MSSTRRLQVMVVSPTIPARWWGAGMRCYQLAVNLASRHDVAVVAYAERGGPGQGYEHEELAAAGIDLHLVSRPEPGRIARRVDQFVSLMSSDPFAVRELRSPEMQQAVDDLVASRRFDVALIEQSQTATVKLPPHLPVVIDEHNIEYELLERMRAGERTALRRFFSLVESRKFRRHEVRVWREADGIAITSEREAEIVRTMTPAPVEAVSNGVDLEHFTPSDAEQKPHSLVFTGLLSYRPNVDGVRYLIEDVLPLVRRTHPDVTLTVVGHGEEHELAELRELKAPGVTVTGRVPDIRPYVHAASIATVPLRIGGGTRLKVVEAMAMGKAIVSTTLGCEGIDVHDGQHLAIGDDAEAFAAAIGRLFDDPELRRRLGRAARDRAVEQYSWADGALRLEGLLERAIAARGTSPASASSAPEPPAPADGDTPASAGADHGGAS